MLTFDDGYASTIEWAVPLCRKYRMPAIFFLNSACIDNKRLAPDNLVCYVVNELGTEVVNAAVRSVKGASAESLKVKSLPDIFSRVLPAISLAERKAFLEALAHLAGIDGTRLAKEAGLYLTREQVNDLANSGFQIGNHTYSHVHCRTLTRSGFVDEIDRNKTELEAMSGRPVRSFSLPYGSSADLTRELAEHLDRSGHELVFLSESTANRLGAKHPHFDRVSIHGRSEDELFCEIEILPRLRGMRNRLFRSRKPVDACQGAQTWDRLSTISENHTN
ncbi:MAG: polysaccharide deacetylase family protein [Acidobacteriota bacterium]|nr:polysaccharide deacetylase family protein [Acidobacteriota bacterium]